MAQEANKNLQIRKEFSPATNYYMVQNGGKNTDRPYFNLSVHQWVRSIPSQYPLPIPVHEPDRGGDWPSTRSKI